MNDYDNKSFNRLSFIRQCNIESIKILRESRFVFYIGIIGLFEHLHDISFAHYLNNKWCSVENTKNCFKRQFCYTESGNDNIKLKGFKIDNNEIYN